MSQKKGEGHKLGKIFQKGIVPWNKGKSMPREAVEKMRLTKLGKPSWNRGIRGAEFKKHYINGMGGTFKTGMKSWNSGNKNYLSGDRHYNWKGGISSVAKRLWQTTEYQQWRSDIYQRDNWTCQTCGKRGDALEVHHTKTFYSILKSNNIKTLDDSRRCNELWDRSIGVTLCKPCHVLTFKGRPKHGN